MVDIAICVHDTCSVRECVKEKSTENVMGFFVHVPTLIQKM